MEETYDFLYTCNVLDLGEGTNRFADEKKYENGN